MLKLSKIYTNFIHWTKQSLLIVDINDGKHDWTLHNLWTNKELHNKHYIFEPPKYLIVHQTTSTCFLVQTSVLIQNESNSSNQWCLKVKYEYLKLDRNMKIIPLKLKIHLVVHNRCKIRICSGLQSSSWYNLFIFLSTTVNHDSVHMFF